MEKEQLSLEGILQGASGKVISQEAVQKGVDCFSAPESTDQKRKGTKPILGLLVVAKKQGLTEVSAAKIAEVYEQVYSEDIVPNVVGDILGEGSLKLPITFGYSFKRRKPLKSGKKKYRIDHISLEQLEKAASTGEISWLTTDTSNAESENEK